MTHYTCDRCGQRANGTKGISGWDVLVDWPRSSQHISDKKALVVSVQVVGKYDECADDAPDLCNDCQAHILQLVANALTPAPECVP